MTPRYDVPAALEGGLDRVESRADGIIQRARLRAYSELTGLATCTVYLRRGAVATLDNVQVLGDDTDALGWRNYDVLILAPTGRIHDGGYIIGLANGVGLLYNGLNLRATGAETARDFLAAPSVDGWQATLYPRERDTAGALTVSSIECRLDSVSSTTPVIRLQAAGASGYADYRAERLPEPAFVVYPDIGAQVLPLAVFRPAIEPFRMTRAGDFTATALADGSGLVEGHWRGAVSADDPDEDYRLTVSGPRPLIRIRGRMAVKLD